MGPAEASPNPICVDLFNVVVLKHSLCLQHLQRSDLHGIRWEHALSQLLLQKDAAILELANAIDPTGALADSDDWLLSIERQLAPTEEDRPATPMPPPMPPFGSSPDIFPGDSEDYVASLVDHRAALASIGIHTEEDID